MNDFVYFGSNAQQPYHLLSNLNAAPIEFTRDDIIDAMRIVNPEIDKFVGDATLCATTIEHLWHALKATDKETFLRFIEGDFASLTEAAMVPFFGVEKAKKKFEYWQKKNNSGIVAKLASNRRYGPRLGIAKSMAYEREHLSPTVERAVWRRLHRLKFAQNAIHAAALQSTKPKTLVEFARGAARDSAKE